MTSNTKVWGTCTAAVVLAACTTPAMMSTPAAPAAVAVPAGNRVAMTAVGIGDLTYECWAKANAAEAFEWMFAGPDAVL